MNLVAELLSAGLSDAPAMLDGRAQVTYGKLRKRVDQAGGVLISEGCRKQDRIGICSENSLFFVVSYLGAIRAGMVAVPFPTDSGPETLANISQEAGIRTVLASRKHAPRVRRSLSQGEIRIIGESELLQSVPAAIEQFPEIDPARDLAALMFTSGSTGRPKGVMVTHGNIATNTRDIVGYMGLTAADRAMVVLPFHYCFGLSVLHALMAVGGSVVIHNEFMYPERTLQELRARACTGLAGVPSTYQILLRKSRFKELEFPDLRWLQQAGGKLPNSCIREILEAFPDVRFYVMYGQTEGTARLSYLPPERLADKLGSIGKGLPSTRLEVLRPDGAPVAPGSSEIGEIVACGDNITPGYWNDPEETAKYFRDGKLHTGDLARVDADGFIYIVEREREMIKSGGNRVSAKEIEDVIAELPGVVEAAVVGVPHPILGEAIRAFVSITAGEQPGANDILQHCRRRLPAFKVPESVVFLPSLPHNAIGKVMKLKLKEMAATVTAELI